MTALPFRWTGEVMEPMRGFGKRADETFVVGAVYRLEALDERSAKSHRHYFAAVNEAWANLPEAMVERFASAEHLRKFALIRTGYADRREIVCSSRAEARRLAAFVKPMDEYALVTATECVVTVWTAQSQSLRAMGKAAFAKSKDDVLGLLAEMIGVTVESLKSAEAA
jgi:hypothetical protein